MLSNFSTDLPGVSDALESSAVDFGTPIPEDRLPLQTAEQYEIFTTNNLLTVLRFLSNISLETQASKEEFFR